MPKFSIIIPTYNEANNLPLLLSDLSIIHEEGEILIIDCGSEDKTVDIANIYGAKIFKSIEKNRGLQLNIGAKNAQGDWFIFLHADSRLNKDWFNTTKDNLIDDESFIYAFKFKVNDKKIIYRLLEFLVNLRSFFFRTPYGDQGLIVNKKTYYENKGFRNIPIMEDLDFLKRLNSRVNLKLINLPIYTSSRKWKKTNIFLQALKIGNLEDDGQKGNP